MTVTNREFERRQFLRTAVTAAAAAATLPALGGLNLLETNGRLLALAKGGGGYGPLVPTADLRDGVKRIALPEGFKYRTFSAAGEIMSDGKKVPLAHDGMGVYNMPDGKLRLVVLQSFTGPPPDPTAVTELARRALLRLEHPT